VAANDDLLQKADALMRRHRVFVAGAAGAAADAPHEDVPVLTEVIAPDALPAAMSPAPPGVDLGELRTALAFQLETWLDEELPEHVLHVLDGITDQLIIQLSLKARSELLPRLQKVLDEQLAPAPADDSEL